MQVSNNNINSMIQLEKRLEESASALSKLNSDSKESNENNKKELSSNENNDDKTMQDTDLVKEMVKQIEIPLAYNANAEVISTQDSVTRTLLDIKA